MVKVLKNFVMTHLAWEINEINIRFVPKHDMWEASAYFRQTSAISPVWLRSGGGDTPMEALSDLLSERGWKHYASKNSP